MAVLQSQRQIEIQGGESIHIVGSVVAGDGLGGVRPACGAAIVVEQNVVKVANVVIENNWFDDGQNSVCIQQRKFDEVTVTLRSNFLGRDVNGLFTNRWDDTKELLREGRDLGIRYNEQ